jgi:hypothetical protein
VLLAVAFGIRLTAVVRWPSVTSFLLAAGSWLAFDICIGAIGAAQNCIYPSRCLLDPFRLEPVPTALSILAPVAALLGYSCVRSARE